MLTIIRKNLKNLFSFSHLATLVLFYSIAWFISKPPLNLKAIYNSEALISNYDLILFSLCLFHFILNILNHFKKNMQSKYKEILLTRLSIDKIVASFILSYFLFFLLGYFIPAYLTAFFQQFLMAPQAIVPNIYLSKIGVIPFGYIIFWIVIALYLLTHYQNEITALLFFILIYICSFSLHFIFDIKFDNYWALYFSSKHFIIWIFSLTITFFLASRITRFFKFKHASFSYKKGIISKIAKKTNANLSSFHSAMLGFNEQKIITLFSFMGLLLLVLLAQQKEASFLPLSKIYLGVFVPLLFSFNQFLLLRIDVDANMLDVVLLKKVNYSKVILNRWFVLFTFQILVVLVYAAISHFFIFQISLLFFLYIVLLSGFYSMFNLFLSLFFKNGQIANFILFFFVYLQLRTDIQIILENNFFSKYLNLFKVFLSHENNTIFLFHWITLFGFIILFGSLSYFQLKRYARLY